MDNLVKMTIYLVDIKNNTEVWRARREFFSGDFPASTLVEVRSLAKPEVLVEIETVAYLGQRFLGSNHIRRRRRVCMTKCG
jgi:2-iminobutanoate/2-iminopropanoate deaminase